MALTAVGLWSGTTEPTVSDGLQVGQMWLDTSISPPVLKTAVAISPTTWILDPPIPDELYVKDEYFSITTLVIITQLMWLDSTVQDFMAYTDYEPPTPGIFPGTTTITMDDPFILDNGTLLDMSGNPRTLFWTDAARSPSVRGLIQVTVITTAGAGTWIPLGSTIAAFVECWGGGGSGAGAVTASSNCSTGGGGGSGAYAASRLTGAAIKQTSYVVGSGGPATGAGSNGNNGTSTTWDTNVIVATFGLGSGGTGAGTTAVDNAGGQPGAASNCTGDIKIDGIGGGRCLRWSGSAGLGGTGGAAPFIGSQGGAGRVAVTGGASGFDATPGLAPGSGGGGGGTLSTASSGGAGAPGMIRIWEYA